MKGMAINGSLRKGRNTDSLLERTLEDAASARRKRRYFPFATSSSESASAVLRISCLPFMRKNAEAFRIIADGEAVGGVVVAIHPETQVNSLYI